MATLRTAFSGIRVHDNIDQAATRAGIGLKTAILLLIATVSGFIFPTLFINAESEEYMLAALIGCIVLAAICGLLGQWIPSISMPCSIIYAISEGALLGLISFVIEYVYVGVGGVVFSAILITETIFISMLLAFSTRIIRVTNTFVRVMIGVALGATLFGLICFIMSLINPDNIIAVAYRTNPTIEIIVSLIIIIYGAFMLMLDFNYANTLVEGGFDKKYEWTAALSLMITIVWIYIEVLRLLAIIARHARRD